MRARPVKVGGRLYDKESPLNNIYASRWVGCRAINKRSMLIPSLLSLPSLLSPLLLPWLGSSCLGTSMWWSCRVERIASSYPLTFAPLLLNWLHPPGEKCIFPWGALTEPLGIQNQAQQHLHQVLVFLFSQT